MIAVRVNISDSGKSERENLPKRLRSFQSSYVTIGVHDGAGTYPGGDAPEVVEVALWMEFGTRDVPERSYLRSVVNESGDQIRGFMEEAAAKVVLENWGVERAWSLVGERVKILVQNKIKSNVPPPLAESTKKGKLSRGVAPVTLIDSGLLLRSISYRVTVK